LSSESRILPKMRRNDLTLGERKDVANYVPGDVLVFHQNAKGFVKGARVVVGGEPPPVDRAERYQVFRPAELEIAVGDVLHVTQNGKTADSQGRLNNGELLTVRGFDDAGNIETDEHKTIGREFGHLPHGYVVTSHASQRSDVGRVLIAQ
jgi:hypothetical protein